MQGKANPRREKFSKNRRGIYYRLDGNGQRIDGVLEFDYYDSDGKRRWKTVRGGIKEAEAQREDLRSRVRRGERVAPSKLTLEEFWAPWLDSRTKLRTRTRNLYRWAWRKHLEPRFGRMRLQAIDEDEVAAFIRHMETVEWRRGKKTYHGYSGDTIKAVLSPLSKCLGHAARRGLIPANPVRKLESDERPKSVRREMRILSRDEIGKLLDNASETYRTMLAAAVFSGARIGELLGLRWCDIDFEREVVHVRGQLEPDRSWTEYPKTDAGRREVILMPALARLLREHKMRSPYSQPSDFVFATTNGTAHDGRNVSQRGMHKAMDAAGLNGDGRPRFRWHDFRHCFASILISQGRDVVFVASQIGHENPAITLRIYAHLFEAAKHAKEARDALEAEFGQMLGRQ